MKLVDVPYHQSLEDTESSQFEDLANKLETAVSLTTKEYDFPVFVPFL